VGRMRAGKDGSREEKVLERGIRVAIHPRQRFATRQTLLREAGYEFTVEPAEINENSIRPGMLPADVARELAQRKADSARP